MYKTIQELLRALPAVHRIIEDPQIQVFLSKSGWSREAVVQKIGDFLSEMRKSILDGQSMGRTESEVVQQILLALEKWSEPNLQNVINATGVLLHTNLGRAPLSSAAIQQMIEVSSGYSNLEYRISEGKRGSRHEHVEELIVQLTGAEAAMVVNNNAAAVFLILRELAKDQEVIVSRGQLVEIGGSFRVSEIMAESGAKLVEVGTTNKTKLSDYENSISPNTALLLKVHTSNFRVIGFTESVQTEMLVDLAKKYELPVYEDLGSGVLYDLRSHGVGDEPTVQEVLSKGVDLVSFSGDKLLGGPQAGIIAGKESFIRRLKKNQLARILRVDKATLAALEATLRTYLLPNQGIKEIPILRDLLLESNEIKKRAEQFLHRMMEFKLLSDWKKEVREDVSEVGGGTMPMLTLPTWTIALSHETKKAHHLEEALRYSKPSVISRITKDQVILDFRTIHEDRLEKLFEVFQRLILE